MKLSTIRAELASVASNVSDRVVSNFQALSTTTKVIAIGATILLAGAAVASNFFSPLLTSAVGITIGIGHLIAKISAIALGALGLSVPSYLLLKKAPEKAEVAVGPEQQETPSETVELSVKAEEAVQPSRLTTLKNASIQFVRNHPKLVIAGSVLAIGVLSAGLMGAQRRSAVVSLGRKAAQQALVKGKNVKVSTSDALVRCKANAGAALVRCKANAGAALVRCKNLKLPTIRKK